MKSKKMHEFEKDILSVIEKYGLVGEDYKLDKLTINMEVDGFPTINCNGAYLPLDDNTEPELKDLPSYGDLITLADFKTDVEGKGFMDCDGTGYLATKDKMSHTKVYPSSFNTMKIDSMFTHVMWFNK